jgi:hypothetical protein
MRKTRSYLRKGIRKVLLARDLRTFVSIASFNFFLLTISANSESRSYFGPRSFDSRLPVPEAVPGLLLPVPLHQPVGRVGDEEDADSKDAARDDMEPGHSPPVEEVAADIGVETAQGIHVADDGPNGASDGSMRIDIDTRLDLMSGCAISAF